MCYYSVFIYLGRGHEFEESQMYLKRTAYINDKSLSTGSEVCSSVQIDRSMDGVNGQTWMDG